MIYDVHGKGARFELPNGRVVELDMHTGDAEAAVECDGWRLREFAETVGLEVTREEATALLHEAAEAGRVREIPPYAFTFRDAGAGSQPRTRS